MNREFFFSKQNPGLLDSSAVHIKYIDKYNYFCGIEPTENLTRVLFCVSREILNAQSSQLHKIVVMCRDYDDIEIELKGIESTLVF